MFFMSKSELQKKYNVNTTKTYLKNLLFYHLRTQFFQKNPLPLLFFMVKTLWYPQYSDIPPSPFQVRFKSVSSPFLL